MNGTQTLTPSHPRIPRPAAHRLLAWAARLLSLASTGLLLAFAFGGHEPGTPNAREWVLLAAFPIGVVAGMLVGWWRALAGGLLGLASLGAFYVMAGAWGRFPTGPYFAIFALPCVLFLASGLLARRRA
jgi:hypothetical protein